MDQITAVAWILTNAQGNKRDFRKECAQILVIIHAWTSHMIVLRISYKVRNKVSKNSNSGFLAPFPSEVQHLD